MMVMTKENDDGWKYGMLLCLYREPAPTSTTLDSHFAPPASAPRYSKPASHLIAFYLHNHSNANLPSIPSTYIIYHKIHLHSHSMVPPNSFLLIRNRHIFFSFRHKKRK